MIERLFPALAAGLLMLLCALPAAAQNGEDDQTEAAEEPTEEPEPQEEPQEEPEFDSRAQRDQQLLARRFPDQARWLELPAPEERTLALFRPALAEPRGALVLFHGAENPPHWSPALANLRRALPRHGWASFALTLPLPEPKPVPPRPEPEPQAAADEADGEAEEGDDAEDGDDAENDEEEPDQEEPEPEPEPLPPRQERIDARIDAALEWLADEGQGSLVVLTDAVSAPAVLARLQPDLEAGARGEPPASGESPLAGPIRALIVVNRHDGFQLSDEQLDTLFAVPELPVLDVFLGSSARAEELRRRHRDVARRNRLAHYQALTLGRPGTRDPEASDNFWVRRIQGFMLRQAEGREVRLPVR